VNLIHLLYNTLSSVVKGWESGKVRLFRWNAIAKIFPNCYYSFKILHKERSHKLYEFNSADADESTILLDFPFNKGKSWITLRDGQKVKFTILLSSKVTPE